MDDGDKVRENRLRRMAERQGLRLAKSRRRDPYATGYGTYRLLDAADGPTSASDAAAASDGVDLNEIEQQLTRRPPQ